jgi:hypothetical protein
MDEQMRQALCLLLLSAHYISALVMCWQFQKVDMN